MQKIISLFKRNYEGNRLCYNEIVEGAEWVANGEGIATRKWDGTCCMIRDGKLYKRYDCKKGKTPPEGFIPAQEPDKVTGHYPGWILCNENNPDDKYHIEAYNYFMSIVKCNYLDGTYELIGPKINGNQEKSDRHDLVPHGQLRYIDCPRTFEEIKQWFKGKDIEGIVWHHEDGRMVKIKKKDFGLKRGD